MRSRLLKITLLIFLALVVLGTGFSWWAFHDLPPVDTISTHFFEPSIRITDRFGRLLYEKLPSGGGRNTYVQIQDIPQSIKLATISTEDASFYQNPGIDLVGILRAFWINLKGGETLAGGSTITQQLARTMLLTPHERSERSLLRKLRESALAWELSRRFSKDQILEMYLNETYYGGMAYGVEAASQTYFASPVSELDLAQSALVAGLAQSPGLYNPFTNPDAAKNRQLAVLDLMEKHGSISSTEHQQAAQEPLIYTSAPYPIEAPHFVLMVEDQLESLFPGNELRSSSGLLVRTTLDLDWQHQAQEIARRQLDTLNRPVGGGLSHNVHNAALVALDPHTGEILALLGSPDYFDASISGAINMALMPAQPGSALKPIIYAAALDPSRTDPWTAAKMILDVRTAFPTHSGQPYVPSNYDMTEHGPVLVREALASSLNIPAVYTLNDVGLESVINLSARLGITTFEDPQHYDLSLALGGGAVRLLELTQAYAAFDNSGRRVTPVSILEIRDAAGKVIYTPPPMPQVQVLDERVAWLITDILSDDNARRIGFGANSALKLDRPAAAKTGTTTNFHDNWTIGYTPDLVVGVWVGNADYQPMLNVTGLTGAGPIWSQFMRTILAGKPELSFQRPDGLVQAEICGLSGLLPSTDCAYRKTEWFIKGTEPKQQDNLYKRVTMDSRTGQLADPTTPPENHISQVVLNLPTSAQAWAHANHIVLLSDLLTGSGISSGNGPLQMLSPDPNATFHLTESLPRSSQRVRLAAAGESGLGAVRFYVDGNLVATVDSPPYEAWWILTPGIHHAWAQAVRSTGEQISSTEVSFEVVSSTP